MYRLLPFVLLLTTTPSLAQAPLSRTAIAALNAEAYAVYSRDLVAADSVFAAAVTRADAQGWREEAAGARLNRGIVTYLRGQYPVALALYQRALADYEALDDAGGQAAVLVEMGNFFKKREEYDRARDQLVRATALAERANDRRLLSNALDIRGQLEQRTGNADAARALYHRALRIRRTIRDTVGLSYVYEHLASLAVAAGRIGPALTYLDSTVQLRSLLGDRQGRAVAVNNQGEALLVAGDTLGAIPYLERSLAESSAVGFTDLQQWTENLLAASYAATGDPYAALASMRRVQAAKDSLYRRSAARQVAEMQERFDSERRERALALERARVQRRTAWLVAAGLGVLLLLGLLIYLVQRQRTRRRLLRLAAEERLREDRLRIARDLHDHLGAELGIVASRLGHLDRRLPDRPLAEVTAQVRYAAEQMRETIWAVRLEAATWTDLFARLRGFAARLDHPAIRFELPPALADEPLDAQGVLELYRFGQEALHNAVKHAAASSIVVCRSAATLCITDNGQGFDPAAASAGYGLSSLRERAARVGGTLRIEPAVGGGTAVCLHLPAGT